MTGRELVQLALLLGALGFVLVFRIGDSPAVNSAEMRVEGVVRQMVASGDWLVPRLDGEPRLQKPPGYYWVGAVLSSIAGRTSWTSVRLGSAVAALGVVAVTFAWGRAIGGPGLGIMAALCLASMHYTFAFGRRGMADMTLSLFAALALASFDRIHFGQRRGWLAGFAAALAGAILAKATTALLLVGLPIGLWLALEGSWRGSAGRDLLVASALAVAVGFSWYAVVLAVLPGASQALLVEALLPLGVQLHSSARSALHYGSPLEYVGPLISGTLPIALFLPLAVQRGVTSRLHSGAPRLRFVAVAFLSLLAAFSVIPQKQRHYLLPLLPLLALLIAEAILDLRRCAPQRLRAALIGLSSLAAPLGILAFGVFACFSSAFLGTPDPVWAGTVACASALFAALAWSAWSGRLRAFGALSLAGVLALELAWYGSVNIWRLELRAGTARLHPGYQAEDWERARSAHPWIARYVLGDRHGGPSSPDIVLREPRVRQDIESPRM